MRMFQCSSFVLLGTFVILLTRTYAARYDPTAGINVRAAVTRELARSSAMSPWFRDLNSWRECAISKEAHGDVKTRNVLHLLVCPEFSQWSIQMVVDLAETGLLDLDHTQLRFSDTWRYFLQELEIFIAPFTAILEGVADNGQEEETSPTEHLERIREVFQRPKYFMTDSDYKGSGVTSRVVCHAADIYGKTYAACFDWQENTVLEKTQLPQAVLSMEKVVILAKDSTPPPGPTVPPDVFRKIKAQAMVQASGPLICTGTWNAGSESHYGYGTGAAASGDYIRGLKTIASKCAGADFIAVTVQEADDGHTETYLSSLAYLLSQKNLDEDLPSAFRKEYVVVGTVWAESKEDGKEDSVLHEVNLTGGPKTVADMQGVVLGVIAAKGAFHGQSSAYAVKFNPGDGWRKAAKDYVRKNIVKTTAHKNAAIIRVSAATPQLNGDASLAICFVGLHLDAKKASTRHAQMQKIISNFPNMGCEFAILAGDFNPRAKAGSCCPWRKYKSLLGVGDKRHLVDVAMDHDEITHDWPQQSWWQDWVEMPVGFLPTFHKHFRREVGRTIKTDVGDVHVSGEKQVVDHCADKCLEGPNCTTGKRRDIRAPMRAFPQGLEQEGLVDQESLINSFRDFWNAPMLKCTAPKTDSMCWQARFSHDNCIKHLCYDIHDKAHCPGFTDRVFVKDLRASDRKHALSVGLQFHLYTSLEELNTADHTPVVALFSLSLSENAGFVPRSGGESLATNSHHVTLLAHWFKKVVDGNVAYRLKWPNGSGMGCYRVDWLTGAFAETGCPASETCYKLAEATGEEAKTWSGAELQDGSLRNMPDSSCVRNKAFTRGVCASNRRHTRCVVEVEI